jgi:hypothetical protein
MQVTRDVALGVVLGILSILFVAGGPSEPASACQQEREASASRDNQELARMYDEDQGDRAPAAAGQPIDWNCGMSRECQRSPRHAGARPR